MGSEALIPVGTGLILLGMLLLVIGIATTGNGNVEGGGIVFIGPIPVVFGSDSRMTWLAVVIGGLMLAALYLFSRT